MPSEVCSGLSVSPFVVSWQVALGRVASLWEMFNWCLMNPLEGETMKVDDPRMVAMLAYAYGNAAACHWRPANLEKPRVAEAGAEDVDKLVSLVQRAHLFRCFDGFDAVTATYPLEESLEHAHHALVVLDLPRVDVAPPARSRDDKGDWDALTPKFSINYFAADDLFFYASATRGFKGGGFNSTGIQEGFEPEFIWSYEVGMRSNWWDRRLLLNLTAFTYDYKDLQVNKYESSTAVVVLENAAKANIKGAELEFSVAPTPGLQFAASLAYLDAKYDDFLSADPDLLPLGIGEIDLSGNRLVRSPKLTLARMGIDDASCEELIESVNALEDVTGIRIQRDPPRT